LLETVRFPVSAITKIAFGGRDLKTAFAPRPASNARHTAVSVLHVVRDTDHQSRSTTVQI
jgi:sugar lactone lactonase YvrE